MWIIHPKCYVKSFDKDTKENEREPNENKGLTKGRLNYSNAVDSFIPMDNHLLQQ